MARQEFDRRPPFHAEPPGLIQSACVRCAVRLSTHRGDIMVRLHSTGLTILGALTFCAARVFGGATLMSETVSHKAPASHTFVYIGSYTQKEKTGITLLDLITKTGELTKKQVVSDGANPTYL